MANTFDAACRAAVTAAPDVAVAWWLMAAYAYHQIDRPILTDGLFDHLGHDLASRWTAVRHPHRHLIDPAALAAGSGYHLRPGDYPAMVIGATHRLIAEGTTPSAASRAVVQMSLF